MRGCFLAQMVPHRLFVKYVLCPRSYQQLYHTNVVLLLGDDQCNVEVPAEDMRRWIFKASEAPLRLVLILIFLEEVPKKASLLGFDDEESSQARMSWCEVTNVCAECQPSEISRSRLKCSGENEPILGGDLCGCCFSCVAVRAVGESCGAELSVLFEDGISILATTGCGEGLACANSVCQNSEAAAPVVPVQDKITLPSKLVFDDEEASLTRDNENRSPYDGTYVPETAKVISSGVTPLWNSSFPLKEDPSSFIKSVKPASIIEPVTKNRQSCYSRIRDEEFVVDLTFEEKHFQLIYTEDLLTDLEILLNIIDKRYLESFLDGAGVDSLKKAFAFDSEKALVPSETSINAPTPGEKLQESTRSKRDHAPRNIGEILIRGASAHREYTEADRPIEIANTSSSAEATSQGDESTVRVRITTHPRKVQTLIDLEDQEKEEEEGEDELSDDMKLAYGRLGEENEDPPSAPPPPRANVSRLKEPHRVAAKGDAATAITVNQSNATEVRWNKTVSVFEERLASLELRIGVFERVLDEMAKWYNLGAPATRDCLLLTQDPEFRVPGQWGSVYPEARDRPNVDEHLALASDIDAVRLLRGDRRRPLGAHLLPLLRKDHALGIGVLPVAEKRQEIFSDPSELQFQGYRPISPGRRLGGFRMWENRRPHDYLGVSNAPRPCYRKSPSRGYSVPSSWRETVSELAPAHRTVQRSVDGGIVPRIIQETQINSPDTSPPYEILPQDRTGNTNRSVVNRGEKNFTESWDSEIQRGDSGRSRRSPERDDHGIISGYHNAISKIRYGSDVSPRLVAERFAKLFEIEPQKSGEKLVEKPLERSELAASAFRITVKEFRRENEEGTETVQRRNSARKFFARNDAEAPPGPRYQTEAGNGDDQDSRESLKAITSFGNSPIRIEDEISDTEYGETPQPRASSASATVSEEDFDHLYESSETEEEDFDYTEHRQYTDGEKEPEVGKFGQPEGEVDWPRVVRRKNGSGQRIIRRTCGPVKGGEGAQRDSEFALVWPLERREKFGAKSSSEFETNRRSEVPTSLLNPARTMEAQSYNPAFPKSSGIERRVQNNGRKLVW